MWKLLIGFFFFFSAVGPASYAICERTYERSALQDPLREELFALGQLARIEREISNVLNRGYLQARNFNQRLEALRLERERLQESLKNIIRKSVVSSSPEVSDFLEMSRDFTANWPEVRANTIRQWHGDAQGAYNFSIGLAKRMQYLLEELPSLPADHKIYTALKRLQQKSSRLSEEASNDSFEDFIIETDMFVGKLKDLETELERSIDHVVGRRFEILLQFSGVGQN